MYIVVLEGVIGGNNVAVKDASAGFKVLNPK
jgi:hypothetical protein